MLAHVSIDFGKTANEAPSTYPKLPLLCQYSIHMKNTDMELLMEHLKQIKNLLEKIYKFLFAFYR